MELHAPRCTGWVSRRKETAMEAMDRAKPETYPAMMTTEEAASLLGRSPWSVREDCKKGALPAIKLGKRWYIRRDVLLGVA